MRDLRGKLMLFGQKNIICCDVSSKNSFLYLKAIFNLPIQLT